MENLNEFYNIDFINNANDINEKSIAIGYLLAQRLNVDIGDQLSIMSPIDQSTSIGLPALIDVTVSKIFNSEVLDFDDRIVFISEEIGKKLFFETSNSVFKIDTFKLIPTFKGTFWDSFITIFQHFSHWNNIPKKIDWYNYRIKILMSNRIR